MKKLVSLLLIVMFMQCKSVQPPKSVSTLENTYWKLAEMNGQPVITPVNTREVHIVLSPEGSEKRLKGFAGCNTIAGSYSTDDSKIKFITISTKMFCQDTMEIENFLLNVLNQTDSYKITGETLELYQAGTFLATFKAVYLK